jgi:hypothetical protein
LDDGRASFETPASRSPQDDDFLDAAKSSVILRALAERVSKDARTLQQRPILDGDCGTQ